MRGRQAGPSREEVLDELEWTIEHAVEHLGEQRATRYLRKFYPWYLARLELAPATAKRVQLQLQEAPSLQVARRLLEPFCEPAAALA